MGDGDGYRLAPVRDVRARDERVKQGDLADAVGDARATQAKIDEAAARIASIRAALEGARTGLRERIANGSTSAQVTVAERHLARLRRDLEAAIDVRIRGETAHRGQLATVDAARARLAIARADKEVVERHFARWREDKRKLAERRED